MENIKIDVIIPFYSNSIWLDEALQSVVCQSYPINKIIVVNDGSSENIDFLISKYPLVEFYFKKNEGAASARNYGIKKSNAEYIFFLDSDDLWDEEKVRIQIEYMISNNLVWSATAYQTFNDKKQNIVTPYYSKKLCWQHIYNSCKIQTSTVAIKREGIAELLKPFAEDMKNGQDIYLWFWLSCRYKLGVINLPLTKFRIRGTNAHLNYLTHIRVRALLWEKINSSYGLLYPKKKMTIWGYELCARIFNYHYEQKFSTKLLFGFAWLLFRISNMFGNR